MFKSECIFIWKIENFSFYTRENDYELASPYFGGKILQNASFYLLFYPNGEYEKGNFASCHLWCTVNYLPLEYECELKLIGASGNTLKSVKCENLSNEIGIGPKRWGCCNFVATKEILQDIESYAEDSLTVYCRLLGKNNSKNISEECVSITKIGVNRLFFRSKGRCDGRWIDNFNKTNICLPDGKRFQFTLFETETEGGSKISVSLSQLQSQNKRPCFIDFTLSLINSILEDVRLTQRFKHFFHKYTSRVTMEFNSVLMTDDTFPYYIYCEFACSSGTKSTTLTDSTGYTSSPYINTPKKIHSSILKDLQALFLNKKFSDVKLRVNGQVIEAHKTVLVARSPVFAVMFDHDMAEARMGIVDITDINIDDLKLFLEFLYTDIVYEMDYEKARNLLMVADKYEVVSLREKCSKFLETNMSVENVCEILSLADATNQVDLKSSCIEFVVRNSATILSSPEWKTWMKNNMELASDIFAKLTLSYSIKN